MSLVTSKFTVRAEPNARVRLYAVTCVCVSAHVWFSALLSLVCSYDNHIE